MIAPIIEIVLTPGRAFFWLFFWPFQHLHPFWGLLAVSLLTGWIIVWIFGKLSDQAAIEALKRQIQGNLLGIWVYQSNIGVVLRLQRQILSDTWTYSKKSLPAALALIPILLLILVQLNLYFSHCPLTPGRSTVLNVRIAKSSQPLDRVSLEMPPELLLETDPVRNFAAREVSWRIHSRQPGLRQLIVRVGQQSARKNVQAGTVWTAISSRRTAQLSSWIWNSGESRLPSDSLLQSIELRYPRLKLRLAGWEVHWVLAYFSLSVAFAFLLKKPIGVYL